MNSAVGTVGDTSAFVKLVILHYHLRPGGIRRVIELAHAHRLPQPPSRLLQPPKLAGVARQVEQFEAYSQA